MAPRAVRWLHRGRPVPTSTKMSLSDTKLHLERLTQSDGGEWSCEQDGVRATSTVRVLGISGPPSVSVYAAFGSRMDLPCQLTERTEKEPLVVQWKKILENQSPQLTGDETLSIYPVRTEHAGPYKCDVTYKGHTMSKHVHLKVIQVSPSGPGFVTEGSPLELLCSVSGSEGDERYKWTGPPPQNEVQWGDTLRLPHVRMEDTGAWNCSVLGKRGELGRVQYELYVHAAQIAGQLTPSLPIFMVLTCLVLFGLVAVIAVCLVQQRRWRLSHLALSPVNDPSGSPPKQI
ncbi:lymphocyte activation gene 3 protein [Discoglossus pictus]